MLGPDRQILLSWYGALSEPGCDLWAGQGGFLKKETVENAGY